MFIGKFVQGWLQGEQGTAQGITFDFLKATQFYCERFDKDGIDRGIIPTQQIIAGPVKITILSKSYRSTRKVKI